MQDKHLYEYAVIRIVPKIEREEFINVGLIMFCKRPKFIKARYHVNEENLCVRISTFSIRYVPAQRMEVL